jgi:phosphoribosylformimino-5-aminoimidazole carboxamide ribotide isomerase
MIIPSIDLMGGKVVQLVQGRDKALEIDSPYEMLRRFAPFREIQVIDLDAAMGTGSNDELVAAIAGKATARVGGGVRSVGRAQQLVGQGAKQVIVGTAALHPSGVRTEFLDQLRDALGTERVLIALDSKGGKVVIKGWKESTALNPVDVINQLEPYCSGFLCTYVDKEGMMQGTDLQWFAELRKATRHEITAAGGITTLDEIRELNTLGIHCALGMAIYTGRLDLSELAKFEHAISQT